MRTRDDDGSEAFSLGEARAVGMTDKALRIRLLGDGAELVDDDVLWVPQSVIHEDSEVWGMKESQREGELKVHRWWAKKQEWWVE